MKLGIIPNITKEDILTIVCSIVKELKQNDVDFIICDTLKKFESGFSAELINCNYLPLNQLVTESDMVVSIGGDGTMLHTAYEVRKTCTPIIGVNFGKLGFLAEFDLKSFKNFISDLRNNNFLIEERIALAGTSGNSGKKDLFAINDIVIDKGSWPKMIELTIKVDDDYVSTFSADGIIIATPTGSTGYSLSTGGPIVNPQADVITISPIAPHTLTMRPLVISSSQKVTVRAKSLHGKIHVSCDGQRALYYDSPAEIIIEKNDKPVRLVHSQTMDYFEILRNKLYWGLDLRKSNNIS